MNKETKLFVALLLLLPEASTSFAANVDLCRIVTPAIFTDQARGPIKISSIDKVGDTWVTAWVACPSIEKCPTYKKGVWLGGQGGDPTGRVEQIYFPEEVKKLSPNGNVVWVPLQPPVYHWAQVREQVYIRGAALKCG